ncbi:MAG: alginate export family protein [Alphaproteobacteria bacterium]|nr:alginate export family protein [Alphaproteobacteria bacterium]
MHRLFFIFTALVLLPLKARAFDPDFKLNGQITAQYNGFENSDLGTLNRDFQSSGSLQPRLRLSADLTDTLSAYVDAGALLIQGDSGAEDETGEVFNESFSELRNFWIKKKELFRVLPLSLQIGRQRIREDRALWWNRDLDAARLNYDTTLFHGFVGLGENLSSYRTGQGSDFRQDDKNRLRALGEGSWQWARNHHFDLRALYEHDHSGIENPGTRIRADDRDEEDGNFFWLGARAHGIIAKADSLAQAIHYRADLIGVGGKEDTLTTISGLGSDFRAVTGAVERDVSGWAVDAEMDVEIKSPRKPLLTLGYAYGSGDDDTADNKDHAFRQTGLHGNSSRLGLSSGSVRNYGEVLRPELSNLHILTAGAGVALTDYTNLSLFYHYYHLDKPATSLRQGSISAALNGRDKSLGHAADLILNTNVTSLLTRKPEKPEDVRLKISLGGFSAGEAYGPAKDETALRAFSELQVRF